MPRQFPAGCLMTCPGCGKEKTPAAISVWVRDDGLMVRYEVCGDCMNTLRGKGKTRAALAERIEAVLQAENEVFH